jgi:hypothetical protein
MPVISPSSGKKIKTQREKTDQDQADDLDPHTSTGEQDESRNRESDRGDCV